MFFVGLIVFLMQISPRQGLLRVREFTLAEIEHFVDPEDKSHPKFSDVARLEFLMFPRDEQKPGHSARIISLGKAVASKVSFYHVLLDFLFVVLHLFVFFGHFLTSYCILRLWTMKLLATSLGEYISSSLVWV